MQAKIKLDITYTAPAGSSGGGGGGDDGGDEDEDDEEGGGGGGGEGLCVEWAEGVGRCIEREQYLALLLYANCMFYVSYYLF